MPESQICSEALSAAQIQAWNIVFQPACAFCISEYNSSSLDLVQQKND